ncbi:MAG TPA: glycerophosphodiester phosphodiesterase family protein [Chloroflexota bacterium]|nr:glycerophosphodiester phosphodiesterase family protein [Chloroflexota bacterium]
MIAHRGASAYAPENTEAAFALGVAMGADAIETDLRQTRDGVVVLLHDALVDRTTDGHGPVAELSWASVRSLDAGAWKHPRFAGERVPTLADFLDRYGKGQPLYLEIKAPEVVEASVAMVRDRGLLEGVVFTSFSFEAVEHVALLASVRTCWLVHQWTPTEAARARSSTLYEVSVHASQLNRALVLEILEAGRNVRAWGLKDDDLMHQAIAAGVSGATVDFPDRLIRLGVSSGGSRR